jgi:hypothetical protein
VTIFRSRAAIAVLTATAATSLTFIGIAASGGGSAQASPLFMPQQACAFEGLTITPPSGGGASSYVPLGPVLSITLNRPAKVLAFLSIDGNVSSATSAEMRASWSVNGAAPTDYEYGTGNIHEGDGPFEGSSTIMDIISLPRGTSRVQPEVRMNGAAGTYGVVGDSCAAVLVPGI